MRRSASAKLGIYVDPRHLSFLWKVNFPALATITTQEAPAPTNFAFTQCNYSQPKRESWLVQPRPRAKTLPSRLKTLPPHWKTIQNRDHPPLLASNVALSGDLSRIPKLTPTAQKCIYLRYWYSIGRKVRSWFREKPDRNAGNWFREKPDMSNLICRFFRFLTKPATQFSQDKLTTKKQSVSTNRQSIQVPRQVLQYRASDSIASDLLVGCDDGGS